MFSSFVKSVTSLSPKALLSRYIAKALASFFDVDPNLVESNLLHDTRVTLRDIHLKEQIVDLGGGKAKVSGRVDTVEFSWTWNVASDSREALITNVSLTISGARFRATKIEDIELLEATIPLEEQVVAEETTNETATPGEETQDWKARYFQQIVDHLTLRVTDMELVLDLLPLDPDSSKDTPQGKHLSILLLGDSIEIASLGQKSPSPSEKAPLTQRLSVGSVSSFVICNSISAQDDATVARNDASTRFPLLEPFTYSAIVTRVTGRRFLDGILNGLEVMGEENSASKDNGSATGAITVHFDKVQAEAFRRVQALLMSTDPDESNPASDSEENTQVRSLETAKEKASGWNSSMFMLPIHSMAVVLPNETEVRLDRCNLMYRTDGKVCSLSGTGGILVDNVHLMECSKWTVDAVAFTIKLSGALERQDGQTPVVARAVCRPDQTRKLLCSLRELQIPMISEESIVSTDKESRESVKGGDSKFWNFQVEGIFSARLEGLNPDDWLSLDLESPAVSRSASNATAPNGFLDIGLASAMLTSSFDGMDDLYIPSVTSNYGELVINEEISISCQSQAVIEQIYAFALQVLDSICFDSVNSSGGGGFPIPIKMKQVKLGLRAPSRGSLLLNSVYGNGSTFCCKSFTVDGFREAGFKMAGGGIAASLNEEISVRITEVGQLSLPDVGRLSSPLRDAVIRFKDQLRVELTSVDMKLEDNKAVTKHDASKALSPRLGKISLPFCVVTSIEVLSVSSSNSGGVLECKGIESKLQPSTGSLPDGLVRIKQISKLLMPGVGTIAQPLLNSSICLHNDSLRVTLASVKAVKFNDASKQAGCNDVRTSEDVYIPFPVSLQVAAIEVVSSDSGCTAAQEVVCTNILADLHRSTGSLPDCTIRIQEISKLVVPGVGRLLQPLLGSSISFRNGYLKVSLQNVRAMTLADDSNKTDNKSTPLEEVDMHVPFPMSVGVESLAIVSSRSKDADRELLLCKAVQADIKPFTGMLPDGSLLEIQEISKLNLPGVGRLVQPVLGSSISVENGSLKVSLHTVRAMTLDDDSNAGNDSGTPLKADIHIPFPICLAVESLAVVSSRSTEADRGLLLCKSVQADIAPFTGRLPNGSLLKIQEISKLSVPGFGYLTSPMLDSSFTVKDGTLHANFHSVLAKIAHTARATSNDASEGTETLGITLPFPVNVAVESYVSVELCDCPVSSFSCYGMRIVGSNVQGAGGVLGGSRVNIPSFDLSIQEITAIHAPGLLSLGSPVKGVFIEIQNNKLQAKMGSVEIALPPDASTSDKNVTNASAFEPFQIPVGVDLAIDGFRATSYYSNGDILREIVSCTSFAAVASPSQGLFPDCIVQAKGLSSVLQVGKMDFHVAPILSSVARINNDNVEVELTPILIDTFDSPTMSLVRESNSASPSMESVRIPLGFTITTPSVVLRDSAKEIASIKGVYVHALPSTGGALPTGNLRIQEISDMDISGVALVSPVRCVAVDFENETMSVECGSVDLVQSECSCSNDPVITPKVVIPFQLQAAVETLSVRKKCEANTFPETILSAKGIAAIIRPSSMSIPEGVITIGELSKLHLDDGYLSSPARNIVITSSLDPSGSAAESQVLVQCASIEAIKMNASSKRNEIAPDPSPISLPCSVRLEFERVSICVTDGVYAPENWIVLVGLCMKASPFAGGTTRSGYAPEGSVAVKLISLSSMELRNILTATNVVASAVIQPHCFDAFNEMILSVEKADLHADFTDVNWADTLAPPENQEMRESLRMPHAQIGPIECRLKYEGQVLSLSETRINFESFLGDAQTNSDDIAKHYVEIAKSRIPALLGSVEVLGSNVGDSVLMKAGRVAVGASTASGCAIGSVVGVGIKDGISGAIASGKKSRLNEESDRCKGESYQFGDFSRGVLRSAKLAAKAGARQRGDDSYVVGDFTAGTVEATGKYVSENRERLSAAGGSGVGLAVGAALLGPVGMIAGAYLGGKAGGSVAAQTCAGDQRSNSEDGQLSNTSKQIASKDTADTRSSNLTSGPGTRKDSFRHQPPTTASTASSTKGSMQLPSAPVAPIGVSKKPSPPISSTSSQHLSQKSAQANSPDDPFCLFTAPVPHPAAPLDRGFTSQQPAKTSIPSNDSLDIFGGTQRTALSPQQANVYQNPHSKVKATVDDPFDVFSGGTSRGQLPQEASRGGNPPLEDDPFGVFSNDSSREISREPVTVHPLAPSTREQAIPSAATNTHTHPSSVRSAYSLDGNSSATNASHSVLLSGYPNQSQLQPGHGHGGLQTQKQQPDPRNRNAHIQEVQNHASLASRQNSQQQQQGQEYHFGDVTRGILSKGKEKRGGKGGYKFGDFTRGLLG